MNKTNFGYWWFGFFIAIVMMLVIFGFKSHLDNQKLVELDTFCKDRGYVQFIRIDRWDNNGEDLLSIICENSNGDLSFTESIPIYNEVFNKPRTTMGE